MSEAATTTKNPALAPHRHELVGYSLGVLAVLIFGASLPMTRLAIGDLGPWFISMGRAAIAGGLALVVLGAARRALPSKAQILRLLVASVCLVFGFPIFTGLALQTVPASHGGVVLGIMPLVTALASSLLYGERPSLGFWACERFGDCDVHDPAEGVRGLIDPNAGTGGE